MLTGVTWFAQSALRFRRGGKVVYVDPWHLPKEADAADLILITHEHGDHLSQEDIARVRADGTEVVVATPGADKVDDPRHVVSAGDTVCVAGVTVRAVPAYNVDKAFHPLEKGGVGYVFELDGVTYYHAGDTDLTEDLRKVKADVAFLPVGGHYTMGPKEAAEAAAAIGPRLAVPIHWGDVVGSRSEATIFTEEYGGESQIMQRGKEY